MRDSPGLGSKATAYGPVKRWCGRLSPMVGQASSLPSSREARKSNLGLHPSGRQDACPTALGRMPAPPVQAKCGAVAPLVQAMHEADTKRVMDSYFCYRVPENDFSARKAASLEFICVDLRSSAVADIRCACPGVIRHAQRAGGTLPRVCVRRRRGRVIRRRSDRRHAERKVVGPRVHGRRRGRRRRVPRGSAPRVRRYHLRSGGCRCVWPSRPGR